MIWGKPANTPSSKTAGLAEVGDLSPTSTGVAVNAGANAKDGIAVAVDVGDLVGADVGVNAEDETTDKVGVATRGVSGTD